MNDNLDKLFKKSLQERECQPPAYIWERIEEHLYKRKKKTLALFIKISAAASILLAGLSLWQILQPKQQTPIDFKHLTARYDSLNLEFDTISFESNHLSKEMNQLEMHCPKPNIRKTELALMKPRVFLSEALTEPQENPELKSVYHSWIPLTSKEALENKNNYQILLNHESISLKRKEKFNFIISGHFVPSYSSGSYSSGVNNTRGYSYNDYQMNGMMNAGGGIQLSVRSNKKLSFQTGIFYSRMGQRTYDNNSSMQIAAFAIDDQMPRVTTPLGNIKTKRKAVAYRTAQAIVLNSMSENTEIIEQVFGTIEIPLKIRYRFYDNRLAFSVSGGLNSGIIVNNKVFLETDNTKEMLGSTEDIRKINFATELGIGVEYPLSKQIKFMIEPGVRYYLQSLSNNPLINFKPYTFTLSTGLGISF